MNQNKYGGFSYENCAGKRNTNASKAFNAVPPPATEAFRRTAPGGRPGANFRTPLPGTNKQGYATMNAITHNALTAGMGITRKRSKTEEEYFDEIDEDAPSSSNLAYLPAPGSPSHRRSSRSRKVESDSEEEDPLDAFMAGIEKQVKKEKANVSVSEIAVNKKKGVRDDIDEEDVEESYYRYMEENPNAGVADEGSDIEVEYDEDGNPIAPPKKRHIDPLPPLDHSEMDYAPFEKNFYTPHEDIQNLDGAQVEDLRKTLGLKVSGPSPPRPVTSFAHFGFDESLLKAVRKAGYTQPTAIQAQAIPAAMSGRDVIGIAVTGSGKTAAFLWPMFIHIMDQKELAPEDGPIGLVLAPTRELSMQIYNEARKFGKVYNINVVCCYGGGSKWEQSKALEAGGAEIVVGTPGRVIDMVKMKATNLTRVTYLVLDEADRMFDMGFEPQVRSICDHVRPDRQAMLFSATFKRRVEKLAREALTDPVRIVAGGEVGLANQDVQQIVLVLPQPAPERKWAWLLDNIVEMMSAGSVLVFVTKKADAEQVANNFKLKEFEALLLHGDMEQAERNKVITAFRKQEVPIMVATDVAARGLDIPHIRTVVNYDVARNIDTHTHRVGRTGRAGEKGMAFTLVSEKDKEFAGHLVRNLEGANQEVPKPLLDLALQSSWFRKSRFKTGKGKNLNVGGTGLGFRERPGMRTGEETNTINSYERTVVKPTKGPVTDRLSAMKEAFKSQYNNQFKASSDHSWEDNVQQQSVESSVPPADPEPISDQDSAKRKGKKSRWE